MQHLIRAHCLVLMTLLGLALGGRVQGPAWGADPVTVWAGSPTEKAVALTFDDGPSPAYTPQILALLKKYHARGTFFVMGHKMEQYPRLVRAELKDGNEVGNHSFSCGPDFKIWQRSLKAVSFSELSVEIDATWPEKRDIGNAGTEIIQGWPG